MSLNQQSLDTSQMFVYCRIIPSMDRLKIEVIVAFSHDVFEEWGLDANKRKPAQSL